MLRLKASPKTFRKFALGPIRIKLFGSDACTGASLTIKSLVPVLEICRRLIDAGYDPSAPLEAYRCEILCLRVRSIGEAARLEINGHGSGFRPALEGGRATPVRSNGGGPAMSTPATAEASATLNCAWFVFCAGHRGDAGFNWIWEDRA